MGIPSRIILRRISQAWHPPRISPASLNAGCVSSLGFARSEALANLFREHVGSCGVSLVGTKPYACPTCRDMQSSEASGRTSFYYCTPDHYLLSLLHGDHLDDCRDRLNQRTQFRVGILVTAIIDLCLELIGHHSLYKVCSYVTGNGKVMDRYIVTRHNCRSCPTCKGEWERANAALQSDVDKKRLKHFERCVWAVKITTHLLAYLCQELGVSFIELDFAPSIQLPMEAFYRSREGKMEMRHSHASKHTVLVLLHSLSSHDFIMDRAEVNWKMATVIDPTYVQMGYSESVTSWSEFYPHKIRARTSVNAYCPGRSLEKSSDEDFGLMEDIMVALNNATYKVLGELGGCVKLFKHWADEEFEQGVDRILEELQLAFRHTRRSWDGRNCNRSPWSQSMKDREKQHAVNKWFEEGNQVMREAYRSMRSRV
ncbi:hypothetical protein P280DRAFT_143480 [Massarina eburnea CBS 473.64]|uniref:Uncharacterized protein n=1 Tax=Massarina eburnea CBS 473.64 TaxID=1395130 RepID=A0A6A6RS73_9PLEO|nr:hypothetical protein P280DRAFT_143480 [Massarina eburnea CBS 473.64]